MQGFINLNNRLRALGGNQEQRMQKGKLRSMQKALLYSYQAADIELNEKQYRCLINPDKIKQDYDDKILSIEFESGVKPGDVFYWYNTNTYWLVYLTNLEEDSYYRGPIRRCRYDITYILDNEQYTTKAAVRGPVETKIVHNLKHDLTTDEPNYTLSILVPNCENNYQFFKRYSRFMLDGICWEVQATNSRISMDNVIEVNAKENYIDPFKDEVDLVNGKIPEIQLRELDNLISGISGESLMQFYQKYTYKDDISTNGTWSVSEPNLVKICKSTEDSIILEARAAGTFDLIRTVDNCVRKRTIKIDSLF